MNLRTTDRRNTCRKNPCNKNPCRKNPCQKDSCEKNTCEKITAKIKSLPTKIPAEKNTCKKNTCRNKIPADENHCSILPSEFIKNMFKCAVFWSQMKLRMKVYSFLSKKAEINLNIYLQSSQCTLNCISI